jgi:hypothetical protein
MTVAQSAAGITPGVVGTDFEYAEALLAALAGMAVRSPRRQADLGVALRRSGLAADPTRLGLALQSLQNDGCVEGLVPLEDGGTLLQVTSRGIERLSHTVRWFVAEM